MTDVKCCAICGTESPHRRLTDDEALVARRIYDANANADVAWNEVESLRRQLARAVRALERIRDHAQSAEDAATIAQRAINEIEAR